MVDPALHAAVSEMLFREARFLDQQKWSQWLDLYTEDAVFWIPATKMEGGYTTDPERELNFTYINGRAGLEARIFRIETKTSIASSPLPRTYHLVTNVMIDEATPREVLASANWQVASFSEMRGRQVHSGTYEYRFRREDNTFRIAWKKIMLLEYVIDGYFDVYSV